MHIIDASGGDDPTRRVNELGTSRQPMPPPVLRGVSLLEVCTIFAYGTHLDPHQMAHHLKGALTADQLTHLNHRHFTVAKLEAAQRDIIDRSHWFTLPRYWGDEKWVAADGTQYDLAEENLLAEKHIHFGGFGGIAYHHVSDLYILLFRIGI